MSEEPAESGTLLSFVDKVSHMGNAASMEEAKEEATTSDTPFTRRAFVTREEEENDAKDDMRKNSSYAADDKSTNEKDVHAHKDNIFKALRDAMDKIHKFPNLRDEGGKWMKDLREGLIALSKQISAIDNMGQLAYGVIGSYKREAGRLVFTSKTINIVCNVVNLGWNIYYEDKEMKLTADQFAVIKLALENLVSFSDSSDEVKCDIAKEEDFLKTLTKILKTCYNSDIRKGGKGTNENIMVFNSLIILYNISQVDENMKRLQGLNNVKIIASYLDTVYRFVALSYLANIINEDQCAYLQGRDHAVETIKFLSDLFSGTLKHPLHQCTDDCSITWSAKECARIIRVLARNEESKKLLAEMGCLPHLVELARCGTAEEQKEAVGAIWALAFDKENQRMMLEDKTLNIVSMLLDLIKSLDTVRKAAEGTLWTLRNELKQIDAYKDLDLLKSVRGSTDLGENSPGESDARRKKGHVMISYNRNHREIVKWIRDQLEAKGYPVWMDIGNMEGSTSQTMAEAIESAHVFLFCCSQGYKNSSNCRQEADYASTLGERLHMIPLLMEEGYKADGWLGFYVGRDYFYDFSGKYPREQKLQELLTKLNKCYQKVQETNAVTVNPISRAKFSVPELRKWTLNDMDNWIKKHDLPRDQFEHITGRDLASLITMRKEVRHMPEDAPEYFYRRIRKDFKIKSLSTTDLFIEALDDLTI